MSSPRTQAMELYEQATDVINGYAEESPLIRALMDDDQDEIDRLVDEEMRSVAEELEEILDSPEKIKRDFEQFKKEMDEGIYSTDECYEKLMVFQNRVKSL